MVIERRISFLHRRVRGEAGTARRVRHANAGKVHFADRIEDRPAAAAADHIKIGSMLAPARAATR